MNGEWANEYLSIYGNCIITSPDSPTAFKICMHSHQCHASEEVIRITRNVLSKCFSLRVMFYNIWMMPSFVTSIAKISPNTLQRAEVIPACIAKQNVDVVLFAEAFCSQGREILIRKMKKHGFLFETQVVGSFSVSQKKVIDGGVFAMSKYPMEHVEEISFGSIATGDDRMSDKGALYFQIRMNGEVVHFFGTHLQAWETQASIKVRKNQAEILKKFMDSMKISSKDAVILSGDLNVDRLSCEGKEEYEDILRKLDVADLEVKEGSEQKYSFDPLTNKLAIDGPSSGGKTEHLDYILYGKSYRQPKRAQVEVIHLKATNDWQQPIDASDFLSMTREEKDQVQDLSDHYPIVAEFHF
jgi:endonuclease/exonuclease/phosphatase family metal-dependent hydrolase